MFVEIHLLQNFSPANLNRDDTGAPKDCEFGGHRRARISSQCLKRAIRAEFRRQQLLPEEHLGLRTKRVLDELARQLCARGKDEAEARQVAQALLGGVKLGFKDDGKSEYLLFLGRREIARVSEICLQHWDALQAAAASASEGQAPDGSKGQKKGKAEASKAVPNEARRAVEQALDGGRAADLALFGRMLADLPERNVDAACQVAHAISTNRVSMELDFYTAVDELKPEDTAGADMMGTVEFTSACFYRYANVDLRGLRENLDGDEELARQTLRAFVRASIDAVPSGKQNSMAAHNPPSLVMAVARERGLWNLANAFVRPVWPTQQDDLVQGSIKRLDDYWGRLTAMYGRDGLAGVWVCLLEDVALGPLGTARVTSVDQLIEGVLGAASFV